jgi:hypothetical protein
MGPDSDDDGSSRPAWTPAPDPNAGDHPLFWDEIPENPEKDSAWLAMEALKEESTLEERAENYKASLRMDVACAWRRAGRIPGLWQPPFHLPIAYI